MRTFYLGLRPRVSYSTQRPTSAETGRLLLLLLLQDNMNPGLERQIIRGVLILLVFPQALPELEGRHQQTPFGRAALVAPVLEGANAKVTPVLEGVDGQDA